eukprot:15345518-Ditylum_brightwellii.AAC.1
MMLVVMTFMLSSWTMQSMHNWLLMDVVVCWDINEQSTPVTVDIPMPLTGPKNIVNKLNGEATQQNISQWWQQQNKKQQIAFDPFDSHLLSTMTMKVTSIMELISLEDA